MAYIITRVFDQNVPIFPFVEGKPNNYSLAWQQVLADSRIGWLKPEAVAGDDVCIAEHPQHILASSVYHVVAFVKVSRWNSDFTQKFRDLFKAEGKTEKEIMDEVKALQLIFRTVVAEIITPTFFPTLVGERYGFNVWPEQLPFSTFVSS